MLLTSGFPPDSRVEKEAVSLAEEGHEVHLLCYLRTGQQELEQTPHFTIHRFRASAFFYNKLSALALIVPLYFNRWKQESEKLHNQYVFDAIHVHDLPLSSVGYYFKRHFGCKLILDQHEFYSDWIKNTAHMNTLQGKLTGFLSDWEGYERKYLSKADKIITVSEPLRENYILKYNIPDDKIISVPNTPSRKIYNTKNTQDQIISKFKDDFVIFYAGGIDILRGIDTAIIALKSLKNTIPNVKLVLCGKVVKPYDPFKTAKEHGVDEQVIFEGWVDEQMLPSYIAASDVCFFTPPANRDEINKTIATKIYQYASMNKPVVVSNAKMMKEFVEHNKLGIAIEWGNSEQFAEAVLAIKEKNKSFDYQVAASCYWENTVAPLCTAYKEL